MMRVQNRLKRCNILSVVAIMMTILLAGCGGGSSGGGFGGNSDGNGGSGGGSSTGGSSAAPTPGSLNLLVEFPPGTPGLAGLPIPVVAKVLRWFSSPAHAQGNEVIISVYRPDRSLVTTAPGVRTGPNQYSFQVQGLSPGNYLFEAVVQGTNGGTLLLLTEIPEGGSGSQTMDVTSTAGALAALEAAPDGDFSGVDAATFNSLAATDPSYQASIMSIETAIQTDQVWIQPNSQTVTSPIIANEVTAAANSSLVVVGFFPANDQTGIATSNIPIFVSFNKPMNPSTVPPAYTNWSVETTVPSSGAPVTITPQNVSAYGTWSYSDSARNIAGQSIPANSVVFHFTGGTLNSNSRQVFQFKFAELPKSSGGDTLISSAGAGTFHTHTFFTGN